MAQRKTEKQRAQENLDTALRVKEKAEKRNARVQEENGALIEKYERLAQEKRDEMVKAAQDVTDANNRVAFLGTHPSLSEPDHEPEADDSPDIEPAAAGPGDDSDVL